MTQEVIRGVLGTLRLFRGRRQKVVARFTVVRFDGRGDPKGQNKKASKKPWQVWGG